MLVVAVLAAVALQNGSASTTSSSATGQPLSYFQKQLARNYKGRDRALPASAPKPQPGKKVWIISCGQAAEGCASGAEGATQAAKILRWKVTTYDGQFNPDRYNQGIQQAIAAKADAIVIDDFDCDPVKESLDQARAKGIKIFAWYAFDCNDRNPSEKPRFDAQVNYGPYKTFKKYLYAYGATVADWIVVKTKMRARTIAFNEKDIKVVQYLVAGFFKEFGKCKTCKIVASQEITLADLGTTLQQKTQSLIAQHPEANSIEGMYDAAITLGIGPAVVASGRKDILVTGGEGFATNVELIRNQQGQHMFAGSASRWTGWAAMDGLNRLFHNQPQVDEGLGFRTGDIDHNLPPKGKGYDGTVDYKKHYIKIWTGKK